MAIVRDPENDSGTLIKPPLSTMSTGLTIGGTCHPPPDSLDVFALLRKCVSFDDLFSGARMTGARKLRCQRRAAACCRHFVGTRGPGPTIARQQSTMWALNLRSSAPAHNYLMGPSIAEHNPARIGTVPADTVSDAVGEATVAVKRLHPAAQSLRLLRRTSRSRPTPNRRLSASRCVGARAQLDARPSCLHEAPSCFPGACRNQMWPEVVAVQKLL